MTLCARDFLERFFLDNVSLGQCVPWDNASLGRCVHWTVRTLGGASLGRCVPWTIGPLDHVSLTDVSRPWTHTGGG